MASPMLPLVFASVLVTVSLLCIALSFATDNWQEVTVNREKIKEEAKTSPSLKTKLETPIYFSRNRGLFRTCYIGNETVFLDKDPRKVDNCLRESGYEIPRDSKTISYGDDYEIRIHLMRAHFGFFVVAMLFLVIAAILGAVGCWQMSPKILRATGLISFLGAFFALGGMAFFHGYEYLENSKITVYPFPADWTANPQHFHLQSNHTVQYGYSYMLGWIGVGCAAIAAILFLCAAMSAADMMEDDARPLSKKHQPTAYDYMGGTDNSMATSMMGMQPYTQQAAPAAQPQVIYPQMYDYNTQPAQYLSQYPTGTYGYGY